MKRSEINEAIRTARETLAAHGFVLPPFASWTSGQWQQAGPDCDRVKRNGMGWDVSDYGGGDFRRYGATIFALRNGNHARPDDGTPYAEKVIILLPGQRLPLHFHHAKMEDIINRGGGILVMELYNSLDDDTVDAESDVTVYCDGVRRVVAAGVPFDLGPGESITLTPRLYHRFWAGAAGGTLLCGEVSTINDDYHDNLFAEPVQRFTSIEEDEPAVVPLCNEY